MPTPGTAKWNTPGLKWNTPGLKWNGPNPLNQNTTMQQNLNSKAITQAQEDAIITKINELKALVDPLTVVVPADILENLLRLGDGRQMYDQKCDEYMHSQPATRPAEVDLAQYDTDGDSIARLGRIRAALLPINERVEGSSALHGSDRMSANFLYCSYLKFGKRFGIPNAQTIYADIMQHYPSGRRSQPATPPPTP